MSFLPFPNSFNASDPLEQFKIKEYISLYIYIINNLKISLTNIALYLITATLLLISISFFTFRYNYLIANK